MAKQKEKEKQSWIFYQSWEKSVNLLTMEEKGQLLTNLINWHNNQEIVLSTPMLTMFWNSIEYSLESNVARYTAQCENGSKGGRPKKTKETQSKPNHNPNETQSKPNDNPKETQSIPNHNLYDNDNDNDNDNEYVNDDDNHHEHNDDYNKLASIASSSTEEPSLDGDGSELDWEGQVFSGLAKIK